MDVFLLNARRSAMQRVLPSTCRRGANGARTGAGAKKFGPASRERLPD